MKKISVIVFLIFSIYANGQNAISDSLIKVLSISKIDSQKVKLYGDISWELISTDINLALVYAEKELDLAKKINSIKDVAQAESDIGSIYNRKADYDNALKHYYLALDLRQKLNQPVKVAGVYTNIATVMMRQNKMKEALSINFKTLKIFESVGDENKQALVLGNIGNLYFNLKQNKHALIYFVKGLALAKKSNNKLSAANISVNIADIKYEDKNYSSAEDYFRNALLYYEEVDDKYSMATVYNNLGNIKSQEKDLKAAINYFNLALKQRTDLEDEFGIAQSHLSIGELLKNSKQYDESIDHLMISLNIFKKLNSSLRLISVYKLLAETNELNGNLKESIIYYKNYLVVKDSVYEKDMSQQLVEMNTKYETDKKQKENEVLNATNKLSEGTISQQRIFSYFILGVLIIVGSLAYFIFKGLKQQKKANRIISLQKKEVEFQKTLVEEHQKETIDSINYAKRIQYALLANDALLKNNLGNYFVLFQPKDIVSGDFYWATEFNNKFYLAVCDSTGHGVPGAFMSLLNMGFLSEAIKEKNISKPNEILNYVRLRLLDSIGNDGQQDGMDAILICMDKISKEITYSAANNEPILIRENQIIELPKDKMPVGKGERMHDFELFEVNYKKGDSLYLYTDGFADQFGGPKGKKFKYKPLNEKLLAIHQKNGNDQKLQLETTLANWRGNLEQVDDVLILGINF